MDIIAFEAAYHDDTARPQERLRFRGLLRESPITFRLRRSDLDVAPHWGASNLKAVLSGAEQHVFDERMATVRPGEVMLVRLGARPCQLPPHPSGDGQLRAQLPLGLGGGPGLVLRPAASGSPR